MMLEGEKNKTPDILNENYFFFYMSSCCKKFCLLLPPQVHQHLPIYAAGIHEFQNRLEQLLIEQAKFTESQASDKR